MKKNKIFSAVFVLILISFAFVSCNALQSTLGDEMRAELEKETGIPSIDGKTWYFDGSKSDNVAGSKGATLAITFNKKIAILSVYDEGEDTEVSQLNGSLELNYKGNLNQKVTLNYPISKGKFADGSEAGTLNASGNMFRLNMDIVTKLLDGKTAKNNEIDGVITLAGFVCDEGDQKGRSLKKVIKNFYVRPFYDEETLNADISFYTSDADKEFTIPTNGSVYIEEDSSVEFELASEYSTKEYFADVEFKAKGSESGIVLVANKSLKGKSFAGTVKITGIVPQMSGSAYERTFTVSFLNPITIFSEKSVTLIKEGEWGWSTYTEVASAEEMAAANNASKILISITGTDSDTYIYYKNDSAYEGKPVSVGGLLANNGYTYTVTDSSKISNIVTNGIFLCNGNAETIKVTVSYIE